MSKDWVTEAVHERLRVDTARLYDSEKPVKPNLGRRHDDPPRFKPHSGSPTEDLSARKTFEPGGVAGGKSTENYFGVDRKTESTRLTPKGVDNVNNPTHYTSGKVECIEAIEAIEAATTGLQGFEAFCVGQILKYTWRHDKKGGTEDLRKAEFYLKRLIRAREDRVAD